MTNVYRRLQMNEDYIISLQDDIVSTGGYLGGLLSLSETNSIKTEVDKAKKYGVPCLPKINFSTSPYHILRITLRLV